MKKSNFILMCFIFTASLSILSCSSDDSSGNSGKSYKSVTTFASGIPMIMRKPAVDSEGTLYVPSGDVIYRIIEDGSKSIITDAMLKTPTGICVDSSDGLIIANAGNHNIIKMTKAGIFSYFIGTTGISGSSNTAGSVSFNSPYGAAISGDILYVADAENSKIRKIDMANSNNTTDFAALTYIYSVKVDPAGNVYGCTGSGSGDYVKKFSPSGVTLATYTIPNVTGDTPHINDIALDSTGNIYAIDNNNSAVYKINPSGNISLFAGIPGVDGDVDGGLLSAEFTDLRGIAIDLNDNIYIAQADDKIKKIAFE